MGTSTARNTGPELGRPVSHPRTRAHRTRLVGGSQAGECSRPMCRHARPRWTRVRTAAEILGCLWFISGCGPSDASLDYRTVPVHWAISEDSTRSFSLGGLDACSDCIGFELAVVLGDRTGPGYVVHTEHALRDSLGRYWLGQYRDMIKVFDAAGNYIQTVGRFGEGPEEFDMPLPNFVDPGGRVHVIDVGNIRETIVGPDFDFLETNPLPLRPRQIVPLPGGAGFVANAPIQSVEALGHPLHIIRGSKVVRSFGGLETGISNPLSVSRKIAVDREGRIYSTPVTEFLIEVWTQTGRRIVGFRGLPLRESDPDFDPSIRSGAPRSAIQGLRVDSSDRLWILILKPRDAWRDHMIADPLSGGGIALRPVDDDPSKVYTSQVVVVDLATSSIVARSERDELFMGFLGDHSLIEARQLEDGTPQVAVWNLELLERIETNQN